VTDILLWVAVAFTLYTGAQYVIDGSAALRNNGTR
jgi:phosphatidylglycerophosphate synthase